MNCKEFEENLALYAYGDLPPGQQAACEAHLAGCAKCRAAREEVGSLHEFLAQRPRVEPSSDFLIECRQRLEETLDREQLGWQGLVREWLSFLELPSRQLASRIAFTLSLAVIGFSLGWTLHSRAEKLASLSGTASVTSASLGGADFENMRINDISHVAPDPQTGAVHITLDAQRRLTLEGSLDDPRIQQVLLYAVKSYDNAGIRRETLDALRTRTDKPNVRAALLYTLEHDSNAGNRLVALDAVRGMPSGDDLDRSLIEVLEHDPNTGVRVETVDVLADHVQREGRDEKILGALGRLATSDRNRYVRMKCASALRNLAGDEP